MWCSRTGRWPRPSPARGAPGFSSNFRSDAMTEPAQAIRLDIPRPAPEIVKGYQGLATTAISDIIDLSCVMRYAIQPLWPDIPRIAGPAFTVRTPRHDNLMLHAAIYRAEPGDVIVVEAGDDAMAVAGGNVCAIAQKRGVAGFIVDGVIRDIGESRASGFPLFKAAEVLKKAQAKADADAKLSLEAWEKNHRSRVDASLKAKGYTA